MTLGNSVGMNNKRIYMLLMSDTLIKSLQVFTYCLFLSFMFEISRQYILEILTLFGDLVGKTQSFTRGNEAGIDKIIWPQ